MPETQPKEQSSRVVVPMTVSDLIYMQLQDLKVEFRETRKELNMRMDRIEARMDKLEARQDKLESKIEALDKKFDDKFDKLADKIDSSMKHSQILAGSCLGITIAVLLALFFK